MIPDPHHQRELFPEAHAVEADALEALDELDVARGLERVRRAREVEPGLSNLDAIEAALEWMGRALEGGRPDPERAARAFLARPAAKLSAGGASFADRALAGFGLRGSQGAFLDAGGLVPRGALLLARDRAEEAWRGLRALADEHPDRGDVLGYAADAARLVGRHEQANELLVRALVADPERVDLARTRWPGLGAVMEELRAGEQEGSARARLFPEAWIRGMLDVPPENGWLDLRTDRLAALAPSGATHRTARLRRFALLLYQDRSRPAGDVDLEAREELAGLDPELFRRVMERLRDREHRS